MPEAETKDIKAAVLELVEDLPNDATWEDVMYRVYVREAIEAGRRDATAGRLVDLAEARRRFGLAEYPTLDALCHCAPCGYPRAHRS